MYDSLRSFFDLQDPNQLLRNDILRIGSVVFILGFSLISTWFILFDRDKKRTEDQDKNEDIKEYQEVLPNDKTKRTWLRRILDGFLSLLFGIALAVLVFVFPMAYENKWHGWLLLASFILGCLFYRREVRGFRLELKPPQLPTRVEWIWLLSVTLLTSYLVLLRWREVPLSMHRDVATICMSGISMWESHHHQFLFNGAGLPGLLDPLYGGGVIMTGSPLFGVRLYPLFCATLCPIILYRWICLFGPKQLAWMVVFILIVSPFFQFYSRVPMGVSILLMQLILFYGITRSLMERGPWWPLMGGIALGLAQWDYYASRGLLLVSVLTPFICVPFLKKLEKGWWYRLFFIASMGFLSLYSMTILIYNYHSSNYGAAFTPKYYERDVLNNLDVIYNKIFGILRMWFDSSGNAVNPLTIPTTSILFGPLAGLLIVGTGFLLFSLFRLPLHLLIVTFLCGASCSLFSDRPPNGHRVLIAMVPVFLATGYGAFCLWGKENESGKAVLWLRRLLVFLMLIWGGSASLMHFHYDMWKDERAIGVQEYDMYARAIRTRNRLNDSNIILNRPGYAQVTFLTGIRDFTFLDYGNWLQPNWDVFRKNAVEVAANMRPLMGLPKSLVPMVEFNEYKNPAGTHAGWEYITGNHTTLGNLGAGKQWQDKNYISGSLMIPKSGEIQITCKNFRIKADTPISTVSGESQIVFQALRGLNKVTLLPTYKNQSDPNYLQILFTPAGGQPEGHLIAPSHLYRIPLRGWLQEIYAGSPNNELHQPILSACVIPTLYTNNLYDEPIDLKGRRYYTRYRSIASLPPGNHTFVMLARGPCFIHMKIGENEMKWEGTDAAIGSPFVLKSEDVNGKPVEITKYDNEHPVDFSLEVIGENQIREVPPYTWFSPFPNEAGE